MGYGSADGGEDLAHRGSTDIAVDNDDLTRWGRVVIGGQVGGELMEEAPFGSIAIQAGAEALGQLEGPLREGFGVKGLEELYIFGVWVLYRAQYGEILLVGEEIQG